MFGDVNLRSRSNVFSPGGKGLQRGINGSDLMATMKEQQSKSFVGIGDAYEHAIPKMSATETYEGWRDQ